MKIGLYLKRYFWDTFSITAFVLVFSMLLLEVPFHIPKFDPLEKALKDFELSDIWFSKVQQRDTILNDPYIRIVDVANLDRGQIGELINRINAYHPKVIGLDIQFIGNKDTQKDSVLKEAIRNSKNIVLSWSFENKEGPGNSLMPLDAKLQGYNNLIAGNTTVRSFSPIEMINGNKNHAFASLVAKVFDESAYNTLLSRNNKEELINFTGNKEKFKTFSPDEIDSSAIAGNIVLIGFCCADCQAPVLEDLHFTPLNPEYSGKSYPDMYGVIIHANIISMILNRHYINEAPYWLLLILAFMFVFFYIRVVTPWFVLKSKHKWFHIVAKITQLLLSVAFLFVELLLLKTFHYKYDMGLIILAIALSIDFIYFYEYFIRAFNIQKSVFFN
jgi:CHASE2 domain-containing sensor protein